MCNCQNESVTTCAATEPRDPADLVRINKYYTHMTNIPRLKILLKCNERSNMRLVLDDVIQDVMEARCTDAGGACCRPKPNSKSGVEQIGRELCKVMPKSSVEMSAMERHKANASKPSVDESERAGPSGSRKNNCFGGNSSCDRTGRERERE